MMNTVYQSGGDDKFDFGEYNSLPSVINRRIFSVIEYK